MDLQDRVLEFNSDPILMGLRNVEYNGIEMLLNPM